MRSGTRGKPLRRLFMTLFLCPLSGLCLPTRPKRPKNKIVVIFGGNLTAVRSSPCRTGKMFSVG